MNMEVIWEMPAKSHPAKIRILAFKNADYRRLWFGAAFNQHGAGGEQVIFSLLVFQITQSTAWVGITLAVYFIPLFVFGILSGAIADWVDRRALLRGIELSFAANMILFAALVALGFAQLWLVMVFTLLSGALRALHQPVRVSYAFDLVGGRQVVAGLGLLNLGSRSGQLIGALLAGSVMHRFGVPAAFVVLAAGHAMAFICFARLRSVGIAAVEQQTPIKQNLREYFAELRGNGILLMLVVVTASVEVFGFSFATALPELAITRLNLGAEGLGMMHAARALGGIVAGLVLAFMGDMRHSGAVYLAVIFAFGTSLWFLAVDSRLALTLTAVVVVSGLAVASDILTQSMMQLSVANRLRGRAMGVWVLAIGVAPAGHIEMGALAVSIGVSGALFANGAVLVAIGVFIALAVPRLRRL